MQSNHPAKPRCESATVISSYEKGASSAKRKDTEWRAESADPRNRKPRSQLLVSMPMLVNLLPDLIPSPQIPHIKPPDAPKAPLCPQCRGWKKIGLTGAERRSWETPWWQGRELAVRVSLPAQRAGVQGSADGGKGDPWWPASGAVVVSDGRQCTWRSHAD